MPGTGRIVVSGAEVTDIFMGLGAININHALSAQEGREEV